MDTGRSSPPKQRRRRTRGGLQGAAARAGTPCLGRSWRQGATATSSRRRAGALIGATTDSRNGTARVVRTRRRATGSARPGSVPILRWRRGGTGSNGRGVRWGCDRSGSRRRPTSVVLASGRPTSSAVSSRTGGAAESAGISMAVTLRAVSGLRPVATHGSPRVLSHHAAARRSYPLSERAAVSAEKIGPGWVADLLISHRVEEMIGTRPWCTTTEYVSSLIYIGPCGR